MQAYRAKIGGVWLRAAGMSVLLGSCWLQAAPPLGPFMPRAEDFTLMWWANGPPHFLGMVTPAPEPVLCMQSGEIGLAIDTQRLKLLHAGRFPKLKDEQRALSEGNAGVFALPPVSLELSVQRGNRRFICEGRGTLTRDEFYFPIRFVESGRFFQRVAIEGLEFADSAGERLEATGRLEIALWPDRAVFSFALEKSFTEPEEVLEIEAGGRRESMPARPHEPVVLKLFGPKNAKYPFVETEGGLEVSRNEEISSIMLKLPSPAWRNAKGTYYPEEELDRLDRWHFTVRNESESETAVPLMFVDEHPPAITGFTPLLCEPDGAPTGIPVQISKNWHSREDKGNLPHQGPWSHGCTFVHLPPRATREFVFAMAYARY